MTSTLLGFYYLPEELSELRATLTYIFQFIKAYDKDTDEQLDEEIYRVISVRVPSVGVSVPADLGASPSCVHNPEALQTPCCWEMWRIPHGNMINY